MGRVIGRARARCAFHVACINRMEPKRFFRISVPGCNRTPVSIDNVKRSCISLAVHGINGIAKRVFRLGRKDYFFVHNPCKGNFRGRGCRKGRLVIMTNKAKMSPIEKIVDCFNRRPSRIGGLRAVLKFGSPSSVLFHRSLGV